MNVSFTLSKMFRLFNQEARDYRRVFLFDGFTNRVNKLVLVIGVMLLSYSLHSQELIELDDYLSQILKDTQTERVTSDNSEQTSVSEVKSQIFDSGSTVYMTDPGKGLTPGIRYKRLSIEANQLKTLVSKMASMSDQLSNVNTFVIKIMSRDDIGNVEALTTDLLGNLPGLNRIFFMIGFKASSKDLDSLSNLLPKQTDISNSKAPESEDGEGQQNIVYLYKMSMPG